MKFFPGEIGLVALVLDDGALLLAHFGHIVAKTISKDRSAWVTYNLAALYWRIKGNAPESVECLKRALHFSVISKEGEAVTFVSLGNVLHHR